MQVSLELATLPLRENPAAPTLHHAADHSFLIALPQGMDKQEIKSALCYGTQASTLKEAEFIHAELDEQVQTGNVAVSPLEAVRALHNLWLSHVAVITQVGRRPCLILYFTWSGLNQATKGLSPMEAMRFGTALHHILQQVLANNPRLGPV